MCLRSTSIGKIWILWLCLLSGLGEIDSKDVIVRPGDFTKEGVLNDVNIKDASYVLVVAEELRGISDESIDARSFLTCNLIHNINPDIYIIAQLLNTGNASILRRTVNNIEIVVSDDITRGLLSSSIVTPGTSKLVNSLITHSQDNIVKLPVSKLGAHLIHFTTCYLTVADLPAIDFHWRWREMVKCL